MNFVVLIGLNDQTVTIAQVQDLHGRLHFSLRGEQVGVIAMTVAEAFDLIAQEAMEEFLAFSTFNIQADLIGEIGQAAALAHCLILFGDIAAEKGHGIGF